MTETQRHQPLTERTLQELQTEANHLAAYAATASREYTALLNEIDIIEQAGVTNATPYYRDERYLYLIHPTAPDGNRQREYIGADPARQREALARIDRHARHQELTARADHAAQTITRAIYQIDNLINQLMRPK